MSAALKQTLMEKLLALPNATPEAAQALHDLFVPVSFRKGTSFPWHEQAANVLYFLETGMAIGYFYYKKMAYTYCALEYGFLVPPSNVSATDEVVEYLAFLTDSTGWSLNLTRVADQAKNVPQLYPVLLEIYQESLEAHKMAELRLRLGMEAAQYEFLMTRHKNLVDKLDHGVLASLLNVASKNLYKIKKKYRIAALLKKAQQGKGA
jgi:hypothetical protein